MIMNIATITNTFVPFAGAVTCFLIISMHLFYHRNQKINRPVAVLWFYFACCLINWISVFFYFHLPDLFVAINALVMFTFIMAQVLFYQFLFHITRLEESERFSHRHYLLPASIALLLTVLMIVTPFESQKLTIMSKGQYKGGSYLFYIVSNSKMAIRLLFTLVYTTLSFIRLNQYRRQIENHSANYEKSSLHWVRTFLILSLSLIPIPLMGMLLPRDVAATSLLLTANNMVILFQYAFLCYHVIAHNFISFDHLSERRHDIKSRVSDDAVETNPIAAQEEKIGHQSKTGISKADFEAFMLRERPYLNPDLRLIDLAIQLNTNRTYLSNFINSEYAINFNRLINQFRMKELESISTLNQNKNKTEKELAEMAGFGSYRNFKRYEGNNDGEQ